MNAARREPGVWRIPLMRAVAWSQEPLSSLSDEGWLEVASGAPDTGAVEPLLRRRLSALGKGMIHCATRASADHGPLRSVFASRHGEPARALPMLEDLAAGQDISPTQFSMNVHNAMAGIWSIARQDRSAATAVGAGPETFGWGLLEAFGLHQADGEPVLFVFGDDVLPEAFASLGAEQTPLHAAGLLIGAPASLWLVVRRDPFAEASEPSLPQSLHALRALSGAETGFWSGPRGAWTFFLE